MHVKKGDQVVLTTGKDVGLTGEVIAVDRDKNRVKVQRRNMIVKHQRPNPLTGAEGARIEVEGWIDASNVSLYSAQLDGPTRTRKKFVGASGELFDQYKAALDSFGEDAPERIRKIRVSPKTGERFDEID
jgi:large subunit ribosomal protein L24